MKRYFKPLLFLIVLVALVVMTAIVASAATSTTQGSNAYRLKKSGRTVYAATLAEALEAADAGTTVTVLKAVTESTTTVVPNKGLTLDGNGQTITVAVSNKTNWIEVGDGVTFTMTNVTAKKSSSKYPGAFVNVTGAGVANVSYSNLDNYIYSYSYNKCSVFGMSGTGGGTLNVTDCTAVGYHVFYLTAKGTLNIDGGTYEAKGLGSGKKPADYNSTTSAGEGVVVYAYAGSDDSTVNIFDGKLAGYRSAVRLSAATVLNVIGGELSHTHTSNTAGTVYFYVGGSVLNMYGGTIKPDINAAIYFHRGNNTANIYGGTLTAAKAILRVSDKDTSGSVNFMPASTYAYEVNGQSTSITTTGAVLSCPSGVVFSDSLGTVCYSFGDGTKIYMSGEGKLGSIADIEKLTIGAIEYYAYNGYLPDLELYESALWASTTFYIHPLASLPAGSYTLESMSQAQALALQHDTTMENWGGKYKAARPCGDIEPEFIVGEGVDLTITAGTYAISRKFVTLKGGRVAVTGGSFTTNAQGVAFSLLSGSLAIHAGTFNGYSACILEIAGEKDKDSVVITGGTFRLCDGDSAGGAIIRTGAAVKDQHAQNHFFDPFDIYRLSSVDIVLSGGLFINDRMSNNQVIDAGIGTSRVIVDGAVLLSKNRKAYFVDANDACGGDVLFSPDAPVCKYGDVTYYYYTVTEAGSYAPVMEKGASVALSSTYEGIRFISHLPAEVVEALSGKTYTLGTLIAPAEYVARAGGFTHKLLNALSAELSTAEAPLITYVDIEAVRSKVKNADGSISFNGALIKLKMENYTRNLAAVSYVLVDGTYYYSAYDSEDHARSMAYVAKQAYTTVGDLSVDYPHRSAYDTSKYCAYTATEQQRLLVYSAYTHTRTSATVMLSTNITVGADASANLKLAADSLKAKLSGLGYTASGAAVLVGNTGAAETALALSEIEGHGYYIGVINGKLVIVGTTNLLTMQALSVFESEHLTEREANGTLILWEDIASNKKMVMLGVDTAFVYSHTRDGNIFDPYMSPGQIANIEANKVIDFNANKDHLYNYEQNPDGVDYPVLAALEMGKAIDYSGYNYRYLPDNLANGFYGIYVGTTAKAHEKFLKGQDLGYYGYAIENGNVIVASFDDATLRLAKKLFLDDLADFAADEGAYMIPVDYSFEKGVSYSYTENGFENYTDDAKVQAGADRLAAELALLATDFPRPEGLQLSDAVTAGDNALELIYSNASYTNYKEYCALLEKEGYTVYMENRDVVGNAFVTYYNRSNNVMLHVMYNAYWYAGRETLYTGRPLSEMFTPCLRIISAVVDGVHISLLPEEFLRINTFEKKTDAKLTVVQITAVGYCYLFTLEDGRFVVLDGGKGDEVAMQNLYNILTELHTEIHGEAPSREKPIEIAAWCLSHDHGDHYGMMRQFINFYCNEQDADGNYVSRVKVGSIIANFPSGDVVYNSMDAGRPVATWIGTDDWFKQDGVAVPYYKVFTGQRFFISNLEFEVMYTNTDIYPWETCYFNNTSTVIRFTSHNTDSEGGIVKNSKSTSVMVLGDLQARGSMVMRAMWGDYLKSDMVAGAHHMFRGSEGELYELIDAQVVLVTIRGEYVQKMFFTGDRASDLEQNREILENTHWLYMITAKPHKSTVKTGQFYNVTMTMGQNGVAGLYEGGDSVFLGGLRNVAGGTAGAFAFGTGQINTGTAHTYKGNYSLIHRANFSIEMPPQRVPTFPPENIPDITPSKKDLFDDEILDLKDFLDWI